MKTIPFLLRAARWGTLAVGILFIVASLGMGLNTQNFLRHSVVTDGTVIQNRAERDTDGNTNYFPQFSFVTADGKPVVIDSRSGSNPPGFHAGQAVQIRYNLADPTAARIDTVGQLWLLPMIFGGLGVFMVLFSLVFAALMRRSNFASTPPPPPPLAYGR